MVTDDFSKYHPPKHQLSQQPRQPTLWGLTKPFTIQIYLSRVSIFLKGPVICTNVRVCHR